MARGPSPSSSPSSSPSPSYRCYGSGRSCGSSLFVVLFVVVPLLLFSMVMFPVDSRTSTYWFSYYSPPPPPLPSSFSSSSGEEGHVELQNGGGGGEVLSNSSHHLLYISLPPATAPSPAPEPAQRSFEDSKPKDKVPVSMRVRRNDLKLDRLELGLARARATIREAIQNLNKTSNQADRDYVPQGPIYRNAFAFHRSYLEMEKVFRVYVYEEGEPPLFHDGPCKSIYSMEGRFIYNMEMEKRLRTRNPDRAHVHFLPFSVTKMVKFLYQPNSFDMKPIKRTIVDYVNVIAGKYPFWNRSLGTDHFMLSCHDWGPHASSAIPALYGSSIRVLCNANTSEGFNPFKDVSLPEINLKTGLTTGIIGGPSASGRPILAFFAGGLHGPIRPVLLKHWKNINDDDIKVYEYLPKGLSYYDMMKKSRFCICPSGYEVASPRIVEAIYLECVPVIISDHYVLPFSDVLNWKSFSVQIPVKDIPNLKKILMSISSRQYIRMQRRVRLVQKHFVVSSPPKRFDVFHMILHSIWLRRLNIRVHPQD